MGVIFAVSALPLVAVTTPFEPAHDFTFKKLAHIAEYGILSTLLFRALWIHISHKGHALLFAVLIAVLYAFSDEWHQTFVPGREGSFRDVAIDALGAVGVSIWLRTKRDRENLPLMGDNII
jgi:VanZ family protein